MAAVPAAIIVPTNPVDQKTILDAIKEADDCLLRVESEKDQIKAIVDALVEQFPDMGGKKYINKMIKTYHKQNFDKESAEHDDFTTLYESIVK